MHEADNDSEATNKTNVFKKMSREKRWLLFVYFPALLVVYMVSSVAFAPESGILRALDVLATIGGNITAYAWCRIDAHERGYELHRHFSYAVIVFGIVALVYYLFRSRGFTGGLKATALFLVYLISSYIAVLVISLVILIPLIAVGALSSRVLG